MAAKKSFKNSPALQFITAEEGLTEEQTQKDTKAQQAPQEPAENPTGTPIAMPVPNTVQGEEENSGIKPAPPSAPGENPGEETAEAMELSPPQALQAPHAPLKLNPMYIETRSKRVQLLMQPTLHGRLRDLSAKEGKSLNDLVHMVLERYAETGDMP